MLDGLLFLCYFPALLFSRFLQKECRMLSLRSYPFSLACLLLALEPTLLAAPPSAVVSTQRGDRYGDPVPAAAIARLGSVRFRQSSEVGSVALSPDGKRIASVGAWNLSVWDVETGRELLRLKERPIPRLVSFSADGHSLLTVDELGTIRHLDSQTGKLLRENKLDQIGRAHV